MLDRIKGGWSVGFFGLGSSNSSLLRCLPLENCRVTIRSDTPISGDIPDGARVLTGEESCSHIDEDIIFFSPSVRRDRPEFIEASERGVILSSDAELFFSQNRKPLFAVTGSDGKSSTAAICQMLLNSGGHSATMVGNMGAPMFERVNDPCDFYVAELSSFMLTYALPRARRACLTSLSPNHLDWHEGFEEYKKTKIRLLISSEEFVVSDENSEIKGGFGILSLHRDFLELRKTYKAEIYLTLEDGFIKRNGEKLIGIEKIYRKEGYNLKNFMTALAMTDGYTDSGVIERVASEFTGLEHRCEKFKSHSGVDYYDSSIDTSPARTAATLCALGHRAVVILGGRDKGLDYTEIISVLQKYVVKAILVGENRQKIFSQIGGYIDCTVVEDFSSAVRLGFDLSRDVGTLLLSPGAASYDMFKNYAHRGDEFQKIILKEIENEENLS